MFNKDKDKNKQCLSLTAGEVFILLKALANADLNIKGQELEGLVKIISKLQNSVK